MTDIALLWNAASFSGDLALTGGALATDDGLRTAILISLFTDARAPEGAALPQDGDDRRGWWGNAFPPAPGRELGSLLWLLKRSKITRATLNRARDYCRDALQWLLADGIAESVDITVEAQAMDRLAIGVDIVRPGGPARQRYDFVWEASI